VNYELEIPKEYWGYKDNHHHFDFWQVSADQLVGAGLKKENIHLSRFCTMCNNDLFFSYRRDKLTGRLANAIGLK
jgi:copper oxidase (laccase) domain-containing protein